MITPEVAKVLLSTMNGNRPLNDSRVVEMAMLMEDGSWVLNGETVKLNTKGELFDGQHRLQACVLAGKPFRTVIVEGVEEPNATHMAAMGEFLMRYLSNRISWGGYRAWKVRDGQRLAKNLGRSVTLKSSIPRPELVAFVKKHNEQMQQALNFVRNTKLSRLMSLSTASCAYYVFHAKSAEDADKFILDLASGTNLGKTDAVYWLRERLIGNAAAKEKLAREMIFGLVVKAWNKRRAGERTGNLKVGASEEFPSAQ
jgi:hypothetical protein